MKLAFTNDGIYGYASQDPLASGGAERQQWLLARALAAAGWSVVVGVREGLKNKERRSISGVEYVGIGAGQILFAWYRFLLLEQPDWWYWRGASHLWGPAGVLAKLTGVRTIFAVALDLDVRVRLALFRRPRWWPLYALGLALTDRILLQHTGQLTGVAARWQSKTSIIPSIAAEGVPGKPHAERGRYVAWVAALRQVKRPDLLIEIANRLPSTRFVVCGGPTTFRSPRGYDTQIVSALKAVPNIDYQGQVAPDDVQGIIRNAALFLSTADEEGFPNTFLEAWLAGTPVVSLKIDPDQVIRRFGLGVVSTGVENAVADICALLNAPSKREMIGSRARQYVTAVHREKAVVSIFERAITGRSSTQTEDHDRSHPLLTPAGLPAMDSMKGK